MPCALVIAVLFAVCAQAATFSVVNTNDSGAGSLRQAMTDANTTPGADTITFAIPAAGLQTIAPLTNLPNITEAVVINGYSQAGSSVNTLSVGDNAVLQIELNGSSIPSGTGLSLANTVNGGEVKGLLMTKWNNAILLNGAQNVLVDGNFLGTNATGSGATFSTANGNALFILNSASGNGIGGATPAGRNVISGNNSAGISLGDFGTINNVIRNNYIGTNAAGTAAVPNHVGISFNGSGTNTIRGNVISGNNLDPTLSAGILLVNTTTNVFVVGNKVGTSADGTAAIPNTYGITLTDGFSGGVSANTIGTLAEPNIIAFNTKAGVALKSDLTGVSRRNAIRYNSIYSNGTLGIDLGDDGITPNDVGDGDTGLFNDLQNSPFINSAQFGGGNVTIAGILGSMPLSTYAVQFFQSPACDPSGAGEGQTYLGEVNVSTDASGVGTFNATFPGAAGGFVTATATDSQGNTSEFSLCQAVTTPATPSISIGNAQITEGNAGSSTMTFNVFLSAVSASTVTVNFATADLTATAGSDYTATSGTVTFNPGQTTQTVSVTILGDLAPEADETFSVNLTNPTNATIADNQGFGVIKNDDVSPSLSISDVTLGEGNASTTSFDFTVTLSVASPFFVTVDYATADGTATVANSDYQPVSGNLLFAPGETTKTISVLVNGDTTTEPNETFFVNLFNPGNASISDGQGIGTIINNEANPSISITDPFVVEGDSGTTNMTFAITLSNPSSSTITVPFTLAANTATAGSDYVTTSGTIIFFPGDTTVQRSISIIGDTTVEPNESFFLNLGVPTGGAILAKGFGVGTILNDDGLALPGISISDVTVTEGNSGITNANFTVQLTASSASTVTVNYATADGLAMAANNDYTGQSGVLTFNPGQTSKTVAVPVNGDTIFEGDETFFVNLTNPTNATILHSQAQGTILNDDVPGSADLVITKTGAATATTNANVTYTIVVSNNGPTGATNVTVTDVLPPGTAFASVVTSQGSCSGTSTVTCSLGTLSNGASAVIKPTITMPAGPASVSNTATVTAAESDLNAGNNAATAVTNVTSPVASADLAVTKTGAATATTNANVAYTITATNNGPSAATNVTVTDVLPAGTSFVSAVPSQGSCSGTSTVTCSLGSLASGANAVITLTIKMPAAPASISNTATVTATEGDPTPGNNAATAVTNVASPVGSADLAITKTGAATAMTSTNVIYTITATNNGPSAATNVTVTDILPAGTSFVSAVPSQGSCSGTSTVTCSIGSLATSASAVITLTIKMPAAPASISNTATVTASESDPNTGNNTATANTNVTIVAPAAIPALSTWALLLLGALLGVVAIIRLQQ
ncbi:MAG TPA: Calx-beta domain-containing protein [Thermoanaerobaculia bacterium]|nr:Calx-beta domain-containing protein [Thermoanaerobaculia bacterium]